MRLVIWNCRYGLLARQATSLAALRPDIAVVPEAKEHLEWPPDAGAPPSAFHWTGDDPGKGIGVLSFGDWRVTPTEPVPRLPWALSVAVSGPTEFHLVAVWTVERPGRPTYATQVRETVNTYRDEFAGGSMVLAGDLNCSGNTANPAPHLANVAEMRELGLESAFHAVRGVEPGDEPMGTLYWRWQESAPFHCDLGFVPTAWIPHIRSVEVGSFEEWVASGISDHAPVVIDVDLPGR